MLEIARYFLWLGFTAFGGPAVHMALMRAELVTRRRWLTDEHFADLLGAVNLIPGPNSTEMALHIGQVRGGWRGLVVAGVCFIGPAMLIVMLLAEAYLRLGALPQWSAVLSAMAPVLVVIVGQAVWGLGRAVLKTRLAWAVGMLALVAYFFNINNLLILLAAGGLMVLARRGGVGRSLHSVEPFSLLMLLLTFLYIGSVLYGSGYVLLAFVQSEFVVRLGWLTPQQVLDAVLVGQVTPGPVFTAATFIGYILGGVPGAVVASVGIFLPAFGLVALSGPLIPRLRQSALAGAFLDGVNVASLGLMAAVNLQLAAEALSAGPLAWGVLALSALGLARGINPTWLIVLGGLVGVAQVVVGG